MYVANTDTSQMFAIKSIRRSSTQGAYEWSIGLIVLSDALNLEPNDCCDANSDVVKLLVY